MEKSEMDQAVIDFNQYLMARDASYGQAMWILEMLYKEYEEKGRCLLRGQTIQTVAAVKKTNGKERLG